MDPELWKRINELFVAARLLEGEKRTAFLKENCGEDEDLFEQVQSLLDIDGKPGLLDSKSTVSTLHLPKVLASRFRIIRYIAEGGMGTVYEAEDLRLHDRVALKTIRPDIASDPKVIERFRREILLGKRVTHPNVCRIHDLGTDRAENGTETLFLTMQLLSGETLASKLKRGPISKEEAMPLVENMIDALCAAHQAGVVHRDFKSGNVMLVSCANRIRAIVMDFGLARDLLEENSGTHTGMVGTVDYMAPEQIRGEKPTPATDIYALGVVIYEMLTGQRPFTGDTKLSVAVKHLNEEPQPPRALLPSLDPNWDEAIVGCLRKLPSERPSITDLKATLTHGRVNSISPSIALGVLPFRSLSSDPEDAYFGEGLAEDLINRLADLDGIRVLARTSAFRLASQEQDIRQLRRRLGVKLILGGSVRRSGGRLRVVAELVNTEDEFQVWSKRYDRVAEDLFTIQDDIVSAITEEIRMRLRLPEQSPVFIQPRCSLDAYSRFLKARFLWNKRTPKDIQHAADLFDEALKLDSSFAPAWTGKGECHLLLGVYGAQAPMACCPQAHEAATRAVELDPQSAEAHAILGSVNALFHWDWLAAEGKFRQALELNPHSSTACQWYANHCLIPQARFAEAWEQIRRARENDPVSLAISASAALIHLVEGDYEQAAAECEGALELDAHFPMAHYFLGQSLSLSGQDSKSIGELKLAVSLSGGSAETIAVLGRMFAASGNKPDALKLLDELCLRAQREYISPVLPALIQIGLSEFDAALDQLELALTVRAVDLAWIGVHPSYAPLRANPRFDRILSVLHLSA